jgi:hypothetical protein
MYNSNKYQGYRDIKETTQSIKKRGSKMDEELIKRIKSWIKDFEKTQPGNVSIDSDTFEGEAYYILNSVLEEQEA